MTRPTVIAGVLFAWTISLQGGDGTTRLADAVDKEFARWVFPGSKLVSQAPVMIDNGKIVGIAPASGEYSTEASFREVVRFYVERSGFKPPNWSILGREFPGDTINLPGFWSAQMGKGKGISIQHHIRRDTAVARLLMTDSDGKRTTAVAITRGLQDARTFIQIARHVQE